MAYQQGVDGDYTDYLAEKYQIGSTLLSTLARGGVDKDTMEYILRLAGMLED